MTSSAGKKRLKKSKQASGLRRVVVVDGCRTPFCRSGTEFTDLRAYDLGNIAVSGLLHQSRIDPEEVGLLVMGTVIADPATSNLGREVTLGAGLPHSCPAYTVTVACVSSLQSFVDAVRAIQTGAVHVAIAAGAETLSDAPLRFRRSLRKRLIASQKARGTRALLSLFKGLKPSDLLPEPVAIAEFTTGEIMGQNCERLVKRVGVSREEQDEYAFRSHTRAATAQAEGLLANQIVPAFVPGLDIPVTADNGVRGDTTLEKLAKLRPAFDKKFGTITAGNSSYLTDGASAVLLMSEEAAERLGYEPLAVVTHTEISAQDPLEELLLGPAYVLPRTLDAVGVAPDDVEVVEVHEAFAGQVLAVLKRLEDKSWCSERLGRNKAFGVIDPNRLNAWGGSLSLGHPFGATGTRLVINSCQRMRHEKARYSLIASCAAGAIGIGVLLERP